VFFAPEGAELWNVGSGREFNQYLGVGRLAEVVGAEPLSHLARFHPNPGIFAGVIGCRFAEDFDPNGAFLKIVRVTVQGILNCVAQEILAEFARLEIVAGKHTIQFLANERFRYRWLNVTRFWIWLLSRE
jgi:hypothetical protein